uniref:Non-specific serine/threonine protein kinase n=1 Tax=Rhizophora mucronata TaxID=61149 RepID=A0A2P2K8H5_RHIMU
MKEAKRTMIFNLLLTKINFQQFHDKKTSLQKSVTVKLDMSQTERAETRLPIREDL